MRKGDGIFMAYEIGGKSQLKLHIPCATLDTYSNMLFVTKNVGALKSPNGLDWWQRQASLLVGVTP